MSGGWKSSNRRAALPPGWGSLRKRILERDNYACTWRVMGEWCGAHATDVDHVIPGTDNSESNLRALCHHHHAQKSQAEGTAASKARAAKRYRPREQHPGMIRPN